MSDKIIPEKNLKNILDSTIKYVMCGVQKCEKEYIELNKIQIKKDNKIANLTNKFQNGKITKEKYELQVTKLTKEFQKTKENFKFIECSLNNCFEFIKKLLLIMVKNFMIKYKDDKEKLNKLKVYYKLFNKTKINIKDVRQFYNEFI